MSETALDIEGLTVAFGPAAQRTTVLDNVSLRIGRGEILGLVGESGSGKSLTALSVMRLLPTGAHMLSGRIRVGEIDVGTASSRRLLDIRGRHAAMIFQEPMTSLNPLFRVGFQIAEVLEAHLGVSRREAKARAIELMRMVGIPAPETRVDNYPHQLSGGMRQRVMIAMAMACVPQLLLADEPTTALDVTIQAQILALIGRLRSEHGMSVLFISHDLGVVARLADRVAVMYAGQVVEEAPAAQIFTSPAHPYTQLLLRSIPRLRQRVDHLYQIGGSPPSPHTYASGCRFHPRCPLAVDRCRAAAPQMEPFGPVRHVRCWRAGEPIEAAPP